MFIIGGGGGIGAEAVSFLTSVISPPSGSVCVSIEIISGALGNSIGSTSITVALSTIRLSLVFLGDVSSWAQRLQPVEVSALFGGDAAVLTESTERFRRNFFGSALLVVPVGVLGDVRDLTVLAFDGDGVFGGLVGS